MLRHTFAYICTIGCLAVGTSARAQIHTFNDPAPHISNNTRYGYAKSVADFTQDGIDEIAIGAINYGSQGRVYIYDGDTFELIRVLDPTPPASTDALFGDYVSSGIDLGGSAGSELLIAAVGEEAASLTDAGVTYVIDPVTSAVLTKIQSPNPTASGRFGRAVVIEDVNSDSIPDLVIGANGEGIGGRFYVLSGANYSVIDTKDSPNPVANGLFGTPIIIPDLNNDGTDDIVITAPEEDGTTTTRSGRVYVYSGSTRALLYPPIISPNIANDGLFGFAVSVIGDVDSDGKSDLIIGCAETTFLSNDGRAYVMSGATGTHMYTINPLGSTFFGFFGVAAPLDDITGDGVKDFVVGSFINSVSGLYSGIDGSFISVVVPDSWGGAAAIPYSINDVDGDGSREFAISGSTNGRVVLYGSSPNISVTPSPVDFGTRSPDAVSPGVRTVTIKNIGLSPLQFQGAVATVTGTDFDEFDTGSLPPVSMLVANGETTMSVEFQPDSLGVKTAILAIFSNDPDSPGHAVNLTGTGYLIPQSTAGGLCYIGGGNTVYGVDLTNGDRFILSDFETGNGPTLFQVVGVEIEDDDSLIVASTNQIFRVDRQTGDRSILFNTPFPGFNAPRGLARENASSMVMGISGSGCARLVLGTGGVTIVSDHFTGTGTNFFTPYDVAMESNGTIIVGDVSGSRLFRVDPANGNRTVFTDGSCPPVYSVDTLGDDDFAVVSNSTAAYLTDGATGATSILSNGSTGTGPAFVRAAAVAVGSGQIYVFDSVQKAVIQVDRATGNRVVKSSATSGIAVGNGPDLEIPFSFESLIFMTVTDTPQPSAVGDWTLYN